MSEEIKLEQTNDNNSKVVVNTCGQCSMYDKNLKGVVYCKNACKSSITADTKACTNFKQKNHVIKVYF